MDRIELERGGIVIGVAEMCKALGITRNTLMRRIESGEIKAVKVAERWDIPVKPNLVHIMMADFKLRNRLKLTRRLIEWQNKLDERKKS